MATCSSCLNGRHRRCEDRGECTCSMCAPTRHSAARFKEPSYVCDDLPAERADKRGRKPIYHDPEHVAAREYMRDYRARVRAGKKVAPTPRITERQKEDMKRLRKRGWSMKMIANEVGCDKNGVWRWLKRMGVD